MCIRDRLICRALSGSPPPAIADELRALYEQVNFHRHLEVRGVELSEDEVQMTLVGPSIGPGFAPSSEFLARVDSAEKMVYRTAERKMGRAYRVQGPVPGEVKEMVSVYLSMPRAASFAVSLRVGGLQRRFSEMAMSGDVITEIFDCLELFTRNEEAALRERIPEDAYYTNFVSLTKSMAPDGKDVDAVGFTSVRGGNSRSVALSADSTAIRAVPSAFQTVVEATKKSAAESVTVEGTLRNADKSLMGAHDVIRLKADDGVVYVVVVPPGMMSDIVTHLWDKRVQVRGVLRGNRIHMTDVPLAIR